MCFLPREHGKGFRTACASFVIGVAALVGSDIFAAGPAPTDEPADGSHLTNQQFVNGEKPDSKWWYEVVGKSVRVEGIAWDTGKGEGDIVMIDGAQVSCSGTNFLNDQVVGRLVRVTGVLKRVAHQPAPAYAQGYGRAWVEYIIERPKVELIDRVKWPWMEEVLR